MTVHLPAPVRAVFAATNAGDTAAFLAAFTDDGLVDDWGREFHGHAAIARWNDGEHQRSAKRSAKLIRSRRWMAAAISSGKASGVHANAGTPSAASAAAFSWS